MTANTPSNRARPTGATARNAHWDTTSDTAPPPAVTAVLGPVERLLWAAAVSSTVSVGPLVRFGGLVGVSVLLLALVVPWGQGVDSFCPPDEPPSCRKLYYAVFMWVFFGGVAAPGLLWTAWKAQYRPWLWHCAVTTRRALLVDGRGPSLAGAVDLTRHPPASDANGRLAFGKKPIRLAFWGALPPDERQRALHWARQAHQAATAMDQAG